MLALLVHRLNTQPRPVATTLNTTAKPNTPPPIFIKSLIISHHSPFVISGMIKKYFAVYKFFHKNLYWWRAFCPVGVPTRKIWGGILKTEAKGQKGGEATARHPIYRPATYDSGSVSSSPQTLTVIL